MLGPFGLRIPLVCWIAFCPITFQGYGPEKPQRGSPSMIQRSNFFEALLESQGRATLCPMSRSIQQHCDCHLRFCESQISVVRCELHVLNAALILFSSSSSSRFQIGVNVRRKFSKRAREVR